MSSVEVQELKDFITERLDLYFKPVLTIDQVAAYTGYAKNTIYSLVNQRKIPFSKPGGKLMFERKKIDKWLTDGERLTRKDIDRKASTYVAVNKLH